MPDAIEQLREALRDGTHVFWPPFMGEAVLALLERVEELEKREKRRPSPRQERLESRRP